MTLTPVTTEQWLSYVSEALFQAQQRAAAPEPVTKEVWSLFIHAKPMPKPLLPPHELYRTWNGINQERFNDLRIRYHSVFVKVTTERMLQTHKKITEVVQLNRGQDGETGYNSVINGAATNGKSTLVKMFGKDFELRLRQIYPEEFRIDRKYDDGRLAEHVPVVYVIVTDGATRKGFAKSIAHFLGIEPGRNLNADDITMKVLDGLRACGTKLLIIDDYHHVRAKSTDRQAVNHGFIKGFLSKTVATMIRVGIEPDLVGEMRAGREVQDSGRTRVTDYPPYGIKTQAERIEWASLVMGLEEGLALFRHEQGTLVKLSGYLHQRSLGHIGGLTFLLKAAAIKAIETGQESITQDLLAKIVLPIFMEDGYKKIQKQSLAPAQRTKRKAAS